MVINYFLTIIYLKRSTPQIRYANTIRTTIGRLGPICVQDRCLKESGNANSQSVVLSN